MSETDESLLSTRDRGASRVVRSYWEVCCTWSGLGCCIDNDKWKERPLAEVVQDSNRHCTDVPCFLVLVAVFVSQIVLISVASGNGADPDTLIHGYNYNGTICDGSGSQGKFTAWAALDTNYHIRVCLDDCDETETDSRFTQNYKSESFMHSYCLPTEGALHNASGWVFNSNNEAFTRTIGDLNTAKWLILGSSLVAVLIGFLYISLTSILGRILVAISIIVTFVGGFILAGYLISHGASDSQDPETRKIGHWELSIGVIIIVLLVMLFFALFWLRKRIELAFDMLAEASRAVADMKSTMVFPVLYSMFALAYMAFWIAIALYIYSAKKKEWHSMPEELQDTFGDSYATLEFNKDLKRAITWHFIGLVFIGQCILYFGFMVLAGTFADWYFSEWDVSHSRKVRGHGTAELSHSPVTESFMRTLKFHIGTIAFGAILITPIRLLRWWLHYTQEKTAGTQNPAARCLLSCVECLLKCLECIIDKCNREGFIFTAIAGTNFCYSSMTALELILGNVARAAMVESISHYLELFGRITIAAGTTAVCIMIMDGNQYLSNNLSSVFFPSLIIFVIAYLIGSLFMAVYETAVDAVFLCFLVDEASHGGRAKFAHSEMERKASVHRASLSPKV